MNGEITLRNIILSFILILLLGMLASCDQGNYSPGFNYSSELKSISSEDKNQEVEEVANVVDPQTGQVMYRVVRKKE